MAGAASRPWRTVPRLTRNHPPPFLRFSCSSLWTAKDIIARVVTSVQAQTSSKMFNCRKSLFDVNNTVGRREGRRKGLAEKFATHSIEMSMVDANLCWRPWSSDRLSCTWSANNAVLSLSVCYRYNVNLCLKSLRTFAIHWFRTLVFDFLKKFSLCLASIQIFVLSFCFGQFKFSTKIFKINC